MTCVGQRTGKDIAGLKEIETTFGVKRPKRLAETDGFEAVVLWNKYRRGDKDALKLLIDYNREDVVNLKTVIEQVYDQLATEYLQCFPKSVRKAYATSSR